MMRNSLLSVLLVLMIPSADILAQRDSSRNDFANAESWFLFEDYKEALPIYQKLLKYEPGNDNLNYRIGVCLLKDPYRVDESIPFLLEASKNINPRHKEGSINEKTAPPDVMYYLGSAYQANDKLDEAISSYKAFLKIMDPEIYDDELVQAQIQSCKNAKRLMSMPVDLDLHPLSSHVNTRYAETHPVISGDGKSMAFITEQPFFDEALYVQKEGENWTLPMSLTAMLGFDEGVYPLAMNHDGSQLLLYYDDEHVGNLYISELEDGFWVNARKLGEPISTKYWESHACFSSDGNSLYFTSNRKGTNGGLDIYRSDRLSDGKWGIPVNLGTKVNSRYNEETPFISQDGNTLYFSSYGHFNMGGYDIFYSTRQDDGTWSEPVNMGYPINTTGDDLFFQPTNNGLGAYQSRLAEDANKFDIFYMDIYSANNPRIYVVTGFVRTEDQGTDPSALRMFIIDPATGDTLQYDIPIAPSGAFSLQLTQGEYNLHFSGEGYNELITPLSITPLSNKKGITIEEVLQLECIAKKPLVFVGEKSAIQMKDTIFRAEAGKALVIPFRGEEEASVISRHWHDSVLVDSDTLVLGKRKGKVVITPLMGENLLELEMTDSLGNIHRRQISIAGTEHIPTRRELRRQEREMSKVGIPPALENTPVASLLLDLRDEAESEQMQDYLDQVDLGEEGIDNPVDLFQQLYEEARAGNLDIEEIDLLLANELSGGDAELLKLSLLINSDGPLNNYLAGLDLEKEGITTAEQLLDHLSAASEANGFTMDEVRESMLKALDPSDAEILLGQLKKAAPEGALKDYLEDLNLEEAGISSVEELLNHLSAVADKQGFTMKEVREALIMTVETNPVKALHYKLQRNAEGPLKDYLESMDLRKQGIDTPRDLYEHLYTQTDDQGFSTGDVDRLLANELSGGAVARLLQQLLENADGALKDYLEGLDLEKEGITTAEELLEHLSAVAEENGFTMEDVRKAMLDATDSPLEVEALFDKLLRRSQGDLRSILENMDLEKEGILTPEELLKVLIQALREKGYRDKDIRPMLEELMPGYADLIGKELGGSGSAALTLALVMGIPGGLFLLFLLFRRRRKKKNVN